MINISILPEYWNAGFIGACGHIRLLNPLMHPGFANDYNVDYGYDINLAEIIPDIVIFERLWHPLEPDPIELTRLLKLLKSNGKNIIYSIDDNLFDYPLYQNSNWFNSMHLSVLNTFMQFADVVVVSTPALKKRLNRYNTNIIVIPNAIDTKTIRKPKRKKSDDTVFGYLISPDNQQYLFTILEALRTVLAKHRENAKFQIAGHYKEGLTKELFGNLPVEFLSPPETSFNAYANWIVQDLDWDFGIAPILKNDFTICKSDMKFLDFTRMGIPGIYTDFEPYRYVKEYNAGLMVDNDWESAISRMIEDKNLRTTLYSAADNYLQNERTLESQIDDWKDLIKDLSKILLTKKPDNEDLVSPKNIENGHNNLPNKKEGSSSPEKNYPGEADDFPPAFELKAYLKHNEHLRAYSDQEIIKHYNKTGKYEGRVCSQVNNATSFVELIDISKSHSLEIGPLHSPLLDCSLPNVKTLDHLSKEELIKKYEAFEDVDTSKIVDVDYVWNREPYADLIDIKFENILASHIIEHTPDLIGFFRNISDILKKDGLLFLIVPDKRFCFDHFREETVLFEVIYAHYQKQTKPSIENIVDMHRANAHNDANMHWMGEHGDKKTAGFLTDFDKPFEQYIEYINQYMNEYTDSHVWKFTPESFEKITNYLYREKVIDLKTIRVYPTVRNTQQFYTIMQKSIDYAK